MSTNRLGCKDSAVRCRYTKSIENEEVSESRDNFDSTTSVFDTYYQVVLELLAGVLLMMLIIAVVAIICNTTTKTIDHESLDKETYVLIKHGNRFELVKKSQKNKKTKPTSKTALEIESLKMANKSCDTKTRMSSGGFVPSAQTESE